MDNSRRFWRKKVKLSVIAENRVIEPSVSPAEDEPENNSLPLTEVFLSKELTLESVMNNFDREFSRQTYEKIPSIQIEEIMKDFKPRKLSFRRKVVAFLSSLKKWKISKRVREPSGSKKQLCLAKTECAAVNNSNPEPPLKRSESDFVKESHYIQKSKIFQKEPSCSLKNKETISPILDIPGVHKLMNSECASSNSLPQITDNFISDQPGTSRSIRYQDTGQAIPPEINIPKRTTVIYTHDLLYLTEEDRRQKYELTRKRLEEEREKNKTLNSEAEQIHSSQQFYVHDKNQIKSTIDLTESLNLTETTSTIRQT